MCSFKLLIAIIIGLLITSSAIAGTVMLMGMGTGAGGGGPPPPCTNKLDFSVACNSQYIAAI